MDDDLSYLPDFAKQKLISLNCKSLIDLADSFAKISDAQAIENEKMFKILYHVHLKECARIWFFMAAICIRIEEVYGVNFNFQELQEKLEVPFKEVWEETKKNVFKNRNVLDADLEKQINEIFKKQKPGEDGSCQT